jgi:nucleotide-binding universal stress UspA family protein
MQLAPTTSMESSVNIKHIAIATDFSEHAQPALRLAAKLAHQWSAKISLLHVYDAAPLGPAVTYPAQVWTGGDFGSLMRRESEALLATARRELLADVTEVEEEAVAHTSAATAVCEYAEQNDVDLIVTGTHGRTGFGRLLIGSVAESVIRHAPCSVLVVRPNTNVERFPKSILVATDFSEQADVALEQAEGIARSFNAETTMLHVYDVTSSVLPNAFEFVRKLEEVEDQIREALEKQHLERFGEPAQVALIAGGSPPLAIADYAQRHDSDVIVLSTHGRTGLSRLVIGSVAEKTARHAPCSVWIARTPRS